MLEDAYFRDAIARCDVMLLLLVEFTNEKQGKTMKAARLPPVGMGVGVGTFLQKSIKTNGNQ